MSQSPNSVSGDARCRQCRRAGEKLFLKGARCYTKKCAIERRNYPPGQHGNTGAARPRSPTTAFSCAKSRRCGKCTASWKARFRTMVDEAQRRRGVSGENLLQLLELRLDNVCYRLGFAASRAQARQIVNHGHIEVNGRRVDIPSYQTRPGDVVRVVEGSRRMDVIQNALAGVGTRVPAWLTLNPNAFEGRIVSAPRRDEIDSDVHEQIIIEFYSR
jgi:small subunit ribosomal protein S4